MKIEEKIYRMGNFAPGEDEWRDYSRFVVWTYAKRDGGRLPRLVSKNATRLEPYWTGLALEWAQKIKRGMFLERLTIGGQVVDERGLDRLDMWLGAACVWRFLQENERDEPTVENWMLHLAGVKRMDLHRRSPMPLRSPFALLQDQKRIGS
jgi:hypothetical protein